MCIRDSGRENADTVNRQTRLANNMLGAEIDFIVRDMDQKTRSIVASRKEAMLRKRQLFYFTEGTDGPVSYTHLDVYKRQAVIWFT